MAQGKQYRIVAAACVCLLVNVLTVLLLVFHYQRKLNECAERYGNECPMRLQELQGLTVTWAAGEGGHYPTNLAFVVQAFTMTSEKRRLRLHPLLCPESESPLKSGELQEREADYTYVNWSAWFADSQAVPKDYPMFYDRSMSNHKGRGIFLIRIDGSVIWDPGATWLRGFANHHPEYTIPIPQ